MRGEGGRERAREEEESEGEGERKGGIKTDYQVVKFAQALLGHAVLRVSQWISCDFL